MGYLETWIEFARENWQKAKRRPDPYLHTALGHLINIVEDMSKSAPLTASPLTTASTTIDAATPASQWAAEAPTTPTDSPLPLDPPTTDAGPVVLDCRCAVPLLDVNWYRPYDLDKERHGLMRVTGVTCNGCGVSLRFGRTHARGAMRESSISPSSLLKQRAATSPAGSATSRSASLTEGWWTNGYQHDYGGWEGPWHWHSGHRHEGGERWHQHTPRG